MHQWRNVYDQTVWFWTIENVIANERRRMVNKCPHFEPDLEMSITYMRKFTLDQGSAETERNLLKSTLLMILLSSLKANCVSLWSSEWYFHPCSSTCFRLQYLKNEPSWSWRTQHENIGLAKNSRAVTTAATHIYTYCIYTWHRFSCASLSNHLQPLHGIYCCKRRTRDCLVRSTMPPESLNSQNHLHFYFE